MRIVYLLLFFCSACSAYSMEPEITDLTKLFYQKEKKDVVFEGTRYHISGPYRCAGSNANEDIVSVTLHQKYGFLRNKTIEVSRLSISALYQIPEITKRSVTYTPLAHLLAGGTLFGAGVLVGFLLKDPE